LKDRPVLTKVLGGLITAAVVSLITFLLPGGWGTVLSWVVAAWNFVCACVAWGLHAVHSVLIHPIPVWAILAALVVVVAVKAARRLPSPRLRKLPEPRDVKNEEPLLPLQFNGLKWIDQEGKLVPCCPKCDLEIRPRHSHGGIDPRFARGLYECDNCGLICSYPRTHYDLLDLLHREIERERRIRQQKAVAG
jgi:hypothetical protein